MKSPKTENDFFADIELAIERVVGKKKISTDTQLKRDLGIDSIAFVDIAFELEAITGLEISFTRWHFERARPGALSNDLEVGQIITQLMREQAGS